MTADEIDALLDGSEETPSLEFKGPMAWDRNSLVKDILAMANVPDGGVIVFGIEDQTLKRVGLTQEQAASFKSDIMRDQIAPFADPHVVFRSEIVVDRSGLRYAIIHVRPFDEMPVVCRRNGSDVKEGTVYYRSPERRPQSAPVGSSSDMRAIIETSIARRLRSLRKVGLSEEASTGYDFDAELGGL
jgi:predicted HTH transcriptional regulator